MNRLNQIAPKVIHRHVISERQAVLEKVRYRAMKFGFPSKGIVRPAQIVLYAKLENGKSSLKFNVNQEMQTIPHEIRLEKSDVFYADKLGLFLHKVAIVNNVETFNSPIYSYPDPNIWTVANEARDLEGIYNLSSNSRPILTYGWSGTTPQNSVGYPKRKAIREVLRYPWRKDALTTHCRVSLLTSVFGGTSATKLPCLTRKEPSKLSPVTEPPTKPTPSSTSTASASFAVLNR